jgi:hypothetical protein
VAIFHLQEDVLVVYVVVSPQVVILLLIDLEGLYLWMVWRRLFEDLKDLVNVETSLDGFPVSRDQVPMLAKLVLQAMGFTIFNISLLVVSALLIELVDLLFLFGTADFIQVDINHFFLQVFNIDFPEDDLMDIIGCLRILNVNDGQQNI